MKIALAPLTRFILAGLLTAACQDDGMVIAEQIPPEPAASGSMMMPISLAGLATASIQELLLDSCGECHGNTATRPPHSLTASASRDGGDPIADITDLNGLVAAGLIEPGFPEDSPLLFAMASGQMPPAASGIPAVSGEDLRRMEKFIVSMDPPSQAEVMDILLRNCGICHRTETGAQAVLPINDIADLGVLVAAGLIVPGDRDLSQLYTLVFDGDMPPRGAGLPSMPRRELARLGGFIDLLQ
jgi:mono/diheme cytochrome c family protein